MGVRSGAVMAMMAVMATFLAGCCESWEALSFDARTKIALVVIVGGASAVVLGPALIMVVLSMKRGLRGEALMKAWLRRAERGRVALIAGAPAQLSLDAVPGVPCSVWIHTDYETFPATFRIDLTARQGAEVLVSQGFDGSDDDEDFLGGPEGVGWSALNTPDKLHIHRVLTFTPLREGLMTVTVTFVPTGDTRLRAGHVLAFVGEPPAGPS